MKCISFGKLNKYYLYIIIFIVLSILYNFILGDQYSDLFIDRSFFTQKLFNKHYFVRQIIFHFFIILLALFQIFIRNKYFSVKHKPHNSSIYIIKLIHIDAEEEIKSKISYKYYILTIFTMIIEDQLLEGLFIKIFDNVDFWMIELIIVSYITSKRFNFKIYKHQKLAFCINTISFILKIITIILNIIICKTKHNYLLFFGIIIYICLITFRSIVNSQIKFYMDIKYISIEKILILYGIIGTIIFLIYSLMTTFILNETYECEKENIESCSKKYMFYENIGQYFKNLITCNFEVLFFELIFIFIGSILLYAKKYFYLLVIKFFTPSHIIFSYPLLFLLDKLVLVIITSTYKDTPFIKDVKNYDYKINKFYLDISGDIISILCFVIYLEIIIFHCCKLDYNIKENIIERGIDDVKNIFSQNNDETFFIE